MKNSSWWLAVTSLLIGLVIGSLLGDRFGAFQRNAEKIPLEASFSPSTPAAPTSGPGYVYFSGHIKQCALKLPTDQTVTLSQVVIMDGGVDNQADQRHIHIARLQADNSYLKIPVDLKEILLAGHTERDPIVQPGDIVVVPERLGNF